MTKNIKISDDKLVMAVRKSLKTVEPRILPTETKINDYGYKCWVCPYCGQLVHRKDRSKRLPHTHTWQTVTDYSNYNMHFGSMHAKPFWREQQVIKTVKRYLKNATI